MSPVGLVAALPAEAQTLFGRRRRLPLQEVIDDGERLIVVAGMGRERAARAASLLLEAGARSLVSWGCAGALHDGLTAGTVVLPSTVLDGQRELPTDAAWRAGCQELLGAALRVDTRALLTVDAVMTSDVAKQAAFARHGAVAVDMESAAIGAVAADAGMPFLVVRAIADTQDMHLPDFLPQVTDAFGRPRPLPLVAALLRQPGALPTLMALQRCWRESLQALSRAAELGVLTRL